MDNTIIITVYTGVDIKNKIIPKSPYNKNCYYFTNNSNLKNKIIENNWNYIFLDNFILENDYLKSSVQSKYVKFLQFINDKKFINIDNITNILYIDDKIISKINFKYIENNIFINNFDGITIRKCPTRTNKQNINQEIEVANHQSRYKKNMDKTIKFIDKFIKDNKLKYNVTMCNTGFIYYKNIDKNRDDYLKLCNNIYNSCVDLEQPECQIFFGMYHQEEYIFKKINKIKFENILQNNI